MNYGLSVLSGTIIAIMIAVNGVLAGYYDAYSSTVIIHIVGLISISMILAVKKINPLTPSKEHLSWLYYGGGVIGVATVVCNNIAFGRISVSAMLALVLLGQTVTSMVIDHFGCLGMEKHKFHSGKIVGVLFICIGITVILIF